MFRTLPEITRGPEPFSTCRCILAKMASLIYRGVPPFDIFNVLEAMIEAPSGHREPSRMATLCTTVMFLAKQEVNTGI